jgi:Dihydrofolate reductase
VIGLIWAQAADRVIGRGGEMPWHLPEDLARFKRVTDGSTVVMGRRTWESLPPRFRPLHGRRNLVVTSDVDWRAEGAEPVASVEEAVAADDEVWIIGGAQLYAATIGMADRLEVTDIDLATDGDAVAPAIGAGWVVTQVEPASGWLHSRTGLDYRFTSYIRG